MGATLREVGVTVWVLEAMLALVAPAAGWLAIRFALPRAILATARVARRATGGGLLARGIGRASYAAAAGCRGVHPVPVGLLLEILVMVALLT
jgi:hypothetical protein